MDILDYLSKLGKKEYIRKNYSLDNIRNALDLLDSPHKKIKNVIHITGTNGKGSVAIYTSRLLNVLGYTTGLFISPHIFDVTERIQYNNEPIKKEILKKYLSDIYYKLPNSLFLKLTYFEILTCVMFLYFFDMKPDFIVLEVGLGAKLDATNVIDESLVSCITSISLDHTEVLGKTEWDILKDKSHIIKPNSIFVCGELKSDFKKYLKNLCKLLNTKFVYCKNDIYDLKFCVKNWKTFCKFKINNKIYTASFPVCSASQPYNLKISLEIIKQLYENKLIKEPNYKVIFKEVSKIIIPFRMQKFNFKKYEIIVDGAHNPGSISNFVNLLKKLKLKEFIICFTMMKDKDYITAIKILSRVRKEICKFIVYKTNNVRSQNINLLYKEALKNFDREKVIKISNINSLLKYIENFCIQKKIFFVGSFYASLVFKNKLWKRIFTM
ncbi:MAG: cyanophycin synthetase [Elusimicrobiota bacterium]|nr:hypothetical protein [Endomicrobiia bacterium]MDW8166153.1 cyanophycin synthetase [Elusimicrobiota bacterium]